MNTRLKRWFKLLPTPLTPRGIRYHGASHNQPAILTSNRIFVLPTQQGMLFTGVLLVMLLGAINYNNNMAFLLCFLLGSLFLISILHTYRNLVELSVKLVNSENGFVGGHALFTLLLSNPNQRTRFDIDVSSEQGVETTTDINLAGYAHVDLAIAATLRGRLKLGRVTLSSRFPLGLIRAWSYVDIEAEALVYPRPADSVSPPPISASDGDRQQTAEQGSDDFHGFRAYQPGDAPRHINWKAVAREQGMMTKQFNRHQSPELWLDWEQTTAKNIEQRLSQLCRWILDADSQQQNYGLRLAGQQQPLGNDALHRQHCLEALALFGDKI